MFLQDSSDGFCSLHAEKWIGRSYLCAINLSLYNNELAVVAAENLCKFTCRLRRPISQDTAAISKEDQPTAINL